MTEEATSPKNKLSCLISLNLFHSLEFADSHQHQKKLSTASEDFQPTLEKSILGHVIKRHFEMDHMTDKLIAIQKG